MGFKADLRKDNRSTSQEGETMEKYELEDDTIKEIFTSVDSHREEIIVFTRLLVATLSENPPGGEEAIAKIIEEKIVEWGLPVSERFFSKEDRPNIVCTVKGCGDGPTLLFNAHIDTKPVFGGGEWKHDPFNPEIVDGKLYGRGTSDMKGCVAACLAAALALKESNVSLKGDLILTLSADEEAGSTYGAKVLANSGLKADAVIIGEPSGLEKSFDALCLASRGICCPIIKVYGTQMHSSQSDKRPCINASVKLAKVLTRFAEEMKGRLIYKSHPLYPKGPTVNPGVLISGGTFYGVVPGESWFGSDIRIIPGMKFEQVKTDLEGFVSDLAKEDPELKLELDYAPYPLNWIPPVEIAADHPVVQASVKATETVLGFKPELIGYAATTDAHFFSEEMGIPTISAFGPGLIHLAHAPDEYIEVEDVISAAKIFALTAINYML